MPSILRQHGPILVPDEDVPLMLPADVDYFLQTGDLPHGREGHEAPIPLRQQLLKVKYRAEENWHVRRAQLFRAENPGPVVRVHSPSGRVKVSYFFDDAHHTMRVETSQSPLSLTYRLPSHPPSAIQSPASPFVLGSPPSPVASLPEGELAGVTGLVDVADESFPPRVFEEERYASYLKALSTEALEAEGKQLEDEKMVVMQKLQGVRNELYERRKSAAGERVKRLTRKELEEALEEATHQLARIRNQYATVPMPLSVQDTRDTTITWMMAALSELRERS
jgi:hypothetical protein